MNLDSNIDVGIWKRTIWISRQPRHIKIDGVDIPPFLNSLDIFVETGLKIATDRVANGTNMFFLATENFSLVAKVATRFLYDLDLTHSLLEILLKNAFWS